VTSSTSPTRTPQPAREVALSDLRPHPGNPRRITEARLAQLGRTLEAEREMLQARPLIALSDGTVIAGNQRLAAARMLGWESIPVVYADLDEETARRWMLLDNRPAGEDDVEALAAMLRELDAGQADLAGYAAEDVDAILRAAQPVSPRDPDGAPPLPAVAKSVLGEVYELGPHRLMCGDATNAADVATLLDGAEPFVMVTDPPYGISLDMEWRVKRGHNEMAPAAASYMKTTLGKVSVSGDTIADWSVAFEHAPSLRVIYVWHAAMHSHTVRAGLERIGFEMRQQIIWQKTVFAMTRGHYQWQHEPCWYARRGKVPWYGGAAQSTLWEAASPKHIMSGSHEDKFPHPTQKPSALFTRPMENHLRPGELVYEPFAGSGTAFVAAEVVGAICYGIELDPVYVDVIRQRYADYVDDPSLAP
jgi:DNA modification methylase